MQDAIEAINVCIVHSIDPGVLMTLSNGLAVYYNDKTKNPSFEVWRTRK